MNPSMDLPLDPAAVAQHGHQAVALLCAGDFAALGAKYGYALAHDRAPALAIREELEDSLGALGATRLAPPCVDEAEVGLFAANTMGHVGSFRQCIPTDGDDRILVELMAITGGAGTHVALEQVSAVHAVK